MVFLIEVPPKKMPAPPAQNKSCGLLSAEENEQVFRLLGARCQTIATSVIQLFQTESPHHTRWVKKDTGIICFVKDNFRKNYFFRLYCLKRGSMVWEHELYNNMEYSAPCSFLHTFEGEEYMIAFNFAHNPDANYMKEIVLSKIEAKRRREEKKLRNSKNTNYPTYNSSTTNSIPQNMNFTADKRKINDFSSKKNKKQKDKLTKADISIPQDFRHLCHVGFDPNTGLRMNSSDEADPQLKQFFEKAGVSKKQLRDKDTREFIYDFINSHGGVAVVKEEVDKHSTNRKPPPPIPGSQQPAPPPVPQRIHNRTAPLPPPSTSSTPARPPPPASFSKDKINANAPPPPPPPPLPPADVPAAPALPPPPPVMSSTGSCKSVADPRSKLLESIREGKALKPVETERRASGDDARGNLLNEIRQGRQLKPANEREIKPISMPEPGSDLAGALARALAERSRAIHSEDDSDADSDSNDDEWEE